MHERALDMRWRMANAARWGDLAITNLISNKREWNNCFMKLGTFVYSEIIAFKLLFYKATGGQSGKNNNKGEITTCAPFVKLVE